MTTDHVQSWNELNLDALATYEPALGQLQQLGLVSLFDSRSLPETIIDVLAMRRDALQTHDAQVVDLVAGHFRALHAWRSNPIEVAYHLAPVMQMPAERVQQAFLGLDLPDEDYNRHYLQGPSTRLLQVTNDTAEILRGAGLLESRAKTQLRYTADYLPVLPG